MTKISQARSVSLDMLLEILEQGCYCHLVLAAGLDKYSYLEKQDRSFIRRLVSGTVERCLMLDDVLGQFSRTPPEKMKPVIRTILRMSVYQILYMDRVPDSAACNEAVLLAGKRGFRGLTGFVNGVLRNISRNKASIRPGSRESAFCLPEWMLARFEKEYGKEEAEAIALSFLKPAPLTARLNRSRAAYSDLEESLRAQGAGISPLKESPDVFVLSGVDAPEKLIALQKGWMEIQDLSSALAGEACPLTPGNLVLDVCGAPGGKAIHAADLLEGKGQVVVRDISPEKVAITEMNIRRSGFQNIRAEVFDALCFDESLEEKADAVIADLPCSGLGVIGRKPDIRRNQSPEKIKEIAALQRDILSVVFRYVKPGGVLVYSTCTISREENEDNREWFLSHFPFEPVDIRDRFSDAFREETLKEGFIQLLPSRHPCDGFFISVMKRTKES